MVNLSEVMEGEEVLDPFCGTGVILVESGLVGARVFGMDSSPAMVEGARRNLCRLQPSRPLMVRGDALRAGSLFLSPFDHVITDPPYGRASPGGADVRGLLARFSRSGGQLLNPGGTICIASPSTLDLSEDLVAGGLRMEAFAYQKVHGSLGRHLYLARKP
jgi:tRNA (guanine10-N2)-dimethyltransferase